MFQALTLVFAILLHALLSNAAPFTAGKRAIDDTLYQTVKLMSQYSSAAYCSNNHNSPGTAIKCGSGNCPLVEQSNTTTVLEYSETASLTDVTGFVATDHTHSLIIISFRGSQTLDNWLTNLDFGLTPTDLCSGCDAHSGFWNSWLDARGVVVPAVRAAQKLYPSYSVVVTGHSLGGAIAPLAAAALRNAGINAAMYSFGAPRVGGRTLSSYISSQKGGNYRVTHWNDPVPRVPLLTMGYVHISPEYYIGVKNKVDVQAGDFKVYDGAINLLKGNAAWLITDVEAHRWYFTQMYKCADPKQKRGVEEMQRFEVLATF